MEFNYAAPLSPFHEIMALGGQVGPHAAAHGAQGVAVAPQVVLWLGADFYPHSEDDGGNNGNGNNGPAIVPVLNLSAAFAAEE